MCGTSSAQTGLATLGLSVRVFFSLVTIVQPQLVGSSSTHPECPSPEYPILWASLDLGDIVDPSLELQIDLRQPVRSPTTEANSSQVSVHESGICVKEAECLTWFLGFNSSIWSQVGQGSKHPLAEELAALVPSGNWICQERCLRPYEPCYQNARPICKSNGAKTEARSSPTKVKESLLTPVLCELTSQPLNDNEVPEEAQTEMVCLASGVPCNGTCSWDPKRPYRSWVSSAGNGSTVSAPNRGQLTCVAHCHRTEEWQCEDQCFPKTRPCRGQCPRGQWLCQNENKCIPLRWVCDGSRLLGCSDGSDEVDCSGCADGMRQCGDKLLCKTRGLNLPCGDSCSIGYERCSDSLCVTHRQACNGTCLREGMLPCSHQCYAVEERCDGEIQCGNREDEADCGQCTVGSRRCPQSGQILCRDESCPEEDTEAEAEPSCQSGQCATTEDECRRFCDHYWCQSEQRCISRIDKLQGCNDLRSFPSIANAIFANVSGGACDSGVWNKNPVDDQQVFLQASCVPDTNGLCPTSVRVSDELTKLWVKCGNACWTKFVHHQLDQLPIRYRLAETTQSLVENPQCHLEDFPELCRGRCKFYDAWFCGERIICSDVPCRGQCPSRAGPNQERFYLCQDQCIPESMSCDNKCQPGRFRCGSRCLDTLKVCNGQKDCFDGADETPDLCQGCQVGQLLCQGQPTCIDQRCDDKCFDLEGESMIDCEFEGSPRNICAPRSSLCDVWMEKRFGPRLPFA